jgi:hypothetical protein
LVIFRTVEEVYISGKIIAYIVDTTRKQAVIITINRK